MKVLILFDKNANEVQRSEESRTIEFYSRLFMNISQFLPSVKVHHVELDYNGEYYLDCFNNSIDSNFQESFVNDLPKHDSYDVVITNSCNPVVRYLYPYVLNLTIGIFGSKPSFPVSYSLDPWGLYWKSLTYNAPLVLESNYENAERFKKKVQPYYEDLLYKQKLNLFPFNSERLPLHIQKLEKIQIDYFEEFEEKHHGDVFWTQKPNVQCVDIHHTFDYDYLKNLPQSKKIEKDSAQLIPYCRSVWASHSTLGFQAALHNVEIDSPSCFYYWKGNQAGTVGSLLDHVFFYDRHSFLNRIDKLKEYATPPQKIQQAISSDIYTYTSSDLKQGEFI